MAKRGDCPKGVDVKVEYGKVSVKGPKGAIEQPLHPEVKVSVENEAIISNNKLKIST